MILVSLRRSSSSDLTDTVRDRTRLTLELEFHARPTDICDAMRSFHVIMGIPRDSMPAIRVLNCTSQHFNISAPVVVAVCHTFSVIMFDDGHRLLVPWNWLHVAHLAVNDLGGDRAAMSGDCRNRLDLFVRTRENIMVYQLLENGVTMSSWTSNPFV